MNTKKKEITLCMGSSCFARGNNRTLCLVKSFLENNGLEAEVFLKGSRCGGACSRGPVMQVDDRVFTGLTPEEAVEILKAEYFGEEKRND